jgi:hypothetical protein
VDWGRLPKQAETRSAKVACSPLTAAVGAAAWVPGALGAVVVVVEGFQQLNQYQQLWTSYRSTAEALKHEKYLFLGRAVSSIPLSGPD